MKERVLLMNMYQNIVSSACDSLISPSKTTHDFIKKVAAGWANLAAIHHMELPLLIDMKSALQALAGLIDNTNIRLGAQDFFGAPLSFGGFKECFPFTDKYVIKFCAKRNPTADEQAILMRAEEHNIGSFFVPSFYIQLPRLIESQNLDKDDDDAELYDPNSHDWFPNPDWEDDTTFTHICIQPRIAPLGETGDNDRQITAKEGEWLYAVTKIPQLRGESIGDWNALNGACINWLADFGHYYGKAGLERLRDFCETFNIWDLHADNVGKLIPEVSGRAAPVILDWMSR